MITLYTAPTPNGHKASIMLEEIGMDYTVHPIQFNEREQKEPWFLKINPNGRIPALIDHDNDDFPVFESGAILLYLAEKSGQLLSTDPKKRSQAIQWVMFQMGGIGPMQGQAHVFLNYAPEKIPYAIERYQKETRRLYEVLNTRLADAEYLAGDYSIADIAAWPWVKGYEWAGLNLDGLDHVQRWIDAIAERPAVQRGLAVPKKVDVSDKEKAEKLKETAKNMLV